MTFSPLPKNNLIDDPRVKVLLTFISLCEGTTRSPYDVGGYNIVVGGSKFSNFTKHPRIRIRLRPGLVSDAAGKYQILSSTYDGLVKNYGFKDFSAKSQDLMALALILEKPNAKRIIEQLDYHSFCECASWIWASILPSRYGQSWLTKDKMDALWKASLARWSEELTSITV